MTTATEYRQYDQECIESAREAQTDPVRKQFLDLAKLWMTAAERVDAQSALPKPICALTSWVAASKSPSTEKRSLMSKTEPFLTRVRSGCGRKLIALPCSIRSHMARKDKFSLGLRSVRKHDDSTRTISCFQLNLACAVWPSGEVSCTTRLTVRLYDQDIASEPREVISRPSNPLARRQ